VSFTVADWGDYAFPNATSAPEYAYYINPDFSFLNTTQTARVVSNNTDLYGLNNTYNAARFMAAYYNNNQTVLDLFKDQLKVGDANPSWICITMRNHI
jgi:hypothetical protein